MLQLFDPPALLSNIIFIKLPVDHALCRAAVEPSGFERTQLITLTMDNKQTAPAGLTRTRHARAPGGLFNSEEKVLAGLLVHNV